MTTWNGRPYPNFTETNWDGNVYWDADLRWDGITLIDPTWDERIAVTSSFTPRIGPQTLYSWSTANIAWSDASLTWAGNTVPSWKPR